MQALRRKIGAAGAAAASAAGGGAAAAWPLALARAGRGLGPGGGLDIAVQDAGAARPAALRASAAEVPERLPERGLFALLSGPRGATGVIALDSEVLAALIERQTLGRVSDRPIPPRRPTRTDAMLAAGLIDAALDALDTALAEDADRIWASGFRFASHLDDPRPLALMLEDDDYRVIALSLSLGGGARRGAAVLALPATGRGEAPARRSAAAAAAEAAVFGAALGEAVMAAPAWLDAVIARVRLPLAQAMALAPGETLRLGAAAVDRIDIAGPDGRRIAGGQLGQTRGQRAVRLDAAAQPAARGPGEMVPGLASLEAAMRAAANG